MNFLPTIIICGKNYSGKSTIGEFLAHSNFFVIECGDIVKTLMCKEHFQGTACEFNEYMKSQYGDSYLLSHIARKLITVTNTTVFGIAIVGVRTLSLFEDLMKMMSWAIGIYIDSCFENR
jgi:cytidylate kinase